MPVRSGPSGARQVTTFADGDFARLVLFGGATGARLAWHVTYRANSTGALRRGRRRDQRRDPLPPEPDQGRRERRTIYPNHPGRERPRDRRPRGLRPAGRARRPSTATFSHAWSDLNDDNTADAGEEIPPSARHRLHLSVHPFPVRRPDCPAPTSRARGTRPSGRRGRRTAQQNGVQAFYLVSRFHDHLAGPRSPSPTPRATSRSAAPAATTRCSRRPTTAPTDGSGGPDANHIEQREHVTPPDGESPTMQMYLFKDSGSPDASTSATSTAATTPASSGTSTRTGSPTASSSTPTAPARSARPHAGAMGEAWSDWYATDSRSARA